MPIIVKTSHHSLQQFAWTKVRFYSLGESFWKPWVKMAVLEALTFKWGNPSLFLNCTLQAENPRVPSDIGPTSQSLLREERNKTLKTCTHTGRKDRDLHCLPPSCGLRPLCCYRALVQADLSFFRWHLSWPVTCHDHLKVLNLMKASYIYLQTLDFLPLG